MEAIAKAVAESGRMMIFDADGLVYAYAGLGRPIDAPHRLFLSDEEPNDLYLRDKLREMSNVLPEVVSPAEISARQSEYALRLEFSKFARLLDFLPGIHEGALIHSGGLPIGPFDPDWKNMLDLALKLNMKFHGIYCSGHATPQELAQVTKQINAPSVMVVHSYHPHLFPVGNSKLLLPQRGQRYEMTMFG